MKDSFLAPFVRVTTVLLVFTGMVVVHPSITHAASASVWWPAEGSHLQNTQPFKAVLDGTSLSSYQMYWNVDGGSLNAMGDSFTDYPHKEALVDVSGWNWHGTGPYVITFVAKEKENIVAQKSVQIYVDHTSAQPVPSLVTRIPLYVDPLSSAAYQAAAWATSRPSDAAAMRTLAAAPTAKWFGEWSGSIQDAVQKYVSQASGKMPVLVAYNIPQRDCGGYSAGGSDNYRAWITAFARGIGSSTATVILEPDALAQLTCLTTTDQATRLSLLSDAVRILKKNVNTNVYIDAGHAGWVDPTAMSARLTSAAIELADGFSLNVSNYDTTASETAYGSAISSMLGGKHFVIDTSRNGNGSNGQWCNASGRTVGTLPTLQTGTTTIDGYLWIKTPGESDGSCNGGPSAGTWWPEYALGLVKGAK